MAINLSNLNISLDTFNKEASGVMNIGQIKLSSDGKSVYRTNNHQTLTILNRTEISSEEKESRRIDASTPEFMV